MIINILGRSYVAYETNEGDLVVIRYSVADNEYIMLRCQLIDNRVDWNTCTPVDSVYICGVVRVRYCVNNNATSNIYLEAIKCEEVTIRELNQVLQRCPERSAIRRWDLTRRRTRQRVRDRCRTWFRNYGSDDINNYLSDIGARMIEDVNNWINSCYTMSVSPGLSFISVIGDYLTEAEMASWRDETRLLHARCLPSGFTVSPIIRRHYGDCP